MASPPGTPPTHFGDAEEDDDAESLRSAMSHESDFDEDDDADYFALEIVNHLPPDKASRLMRSLRAKEKAVQDLLRRNQRLLGSCQKLDEENQSLEERLKDAVEAPAAAPPPEAKAPPPAPAAPVDTSIFAQMERGKEERILKLKAENEKMAMHMRRLDENNRRLDEALQQAQKELRRVSKLKTPEQAQRARPDEEEERLYRKFQEEAAGDLIVQRFQQRQAEQRSQLQDALRALLREDMKRIGAWGSDVAALLLAVDGVEAKLRGGKASNSRASGGQGSGKKAAKSAAAAGAASPGGPSSDEVLEMSARLIDDFDRLRTGLEDAERTQLALEQTVGGLRDGAETAVASMDLDGDLAAAEKEAEWIREHNASWVDRVQALSLGPTADLLAQTEAACRAMFEGAPPGLIPPHVATCIQETCEQFSALRGKITNQSQELGGLQEASVSLGRRVKALQAAQRAHRAGLQNRVAEEIQRILGAVEGPLEGVRDTLRRQRETVVKARQKTSGCLEDLAAAVRRGATNAQNSAGSVDGAATGETGAEHLIHEVREVRAMGKTMVASLEEGAKVLEARMDQVLAAVVGEATPSKGVAGGASTEKAALGGRAAAEDPTSGPAGAAQSKAQRKKANKKANAAASASAAPPAAPNAQATAVAEPPPSSQTPPKSSKGATDEDSETRAEFLAAFAGGAEGRKKKKAAAVTNHLSAQPPPPAAEHSPKAGPELLRELQALRDGSEALEARMTARMATRAAGGDLFAGPSGDDAVGDPGLLGEDEPPEEPPEAKPATTRRKKRYD